MYIGLLKIEYIRATWGAKRYNQRVDFVCWMFPINNPDS